MSDNRHALDKQVSYKVKFKQTMYGLEKIFTHVKDDTLEGDPIHHYLTKKMTVGKHRVTNKVSTNNLPSKNHNLDKQFNEKKVKLSTAVLEKMLKAMLIDINKVDLHFSKSKPNVIKAKFKARTYNLTELLQVADLNRIKFDDKEKSNYVKQCLNNHDFVHHASNERGSTENIKKEFNKKIDEYFAQTRDQVQKEKYLQLNLAEKLALNIYSGSAYKDINKLLRGISFKNEISNQNPSYIKELLLHAAMSISAINRHAEPIESTIHANYNLNLDIINKKRTQDLFKKKELISTAFAKNKFIDVTQLTPKGNRCFTLLNGVFGFNVAPLSSKTSEKKYLLAPSIIRYELKYAKNAIHVFEATKLIQREKRKDKQNVAVAPTAPQKKSSAIPPPSLPLDNNPSNWEVFEYDKLPPLPSLPDEIKMPPLPSAPGNTKRILTRLNAATSQKHKVDNQRLPILTHPIKAAKNKR